jgi:hypothetical protein
LPFLLLGWEDKKIEILLLVILVYTNINMNMQKHIRKAPTERFMLPIVDDEMLEKRVALNTEFNAVVKDSAYPAPCVWLVLMYGADLSDTLVDKDECVRIRGVIDQIRGQIRGQ